MIETAPSPFRESLITELTPWSAVERSEQFPDTFTFPAYGGSGVIFYGLDQSGFQGANCNLSAKFLPRFGTSVDDLNVYHKRMHSAHMLFDDMLGTSNQMPIGYMTFEMSIDGYTLAPGDLTILAHDWQRVTNLHDGTTCTSYQFKSGVRMQVEHVLPVGSVTPHFRVRFESTDGKAHQIKFSFQLKTRTRHGMALWDQTPTYLHADAGGALAAGAVALQDGLYHTLADYTLGWAVAMTGAKHHLQQKIGRVTLAAERVFDIDAATPGAAEIAVVFGSSETGTATQESLTTALRQAVASSFDDAVQQSRAYWAAFFARTAAIETGEVVEEYLFHKSLILLSSGMALDTGAPPCFQFVSGCTWWQNGTYHDAMHVARGLLQTNALPEVSDFVHWMRDYAWQKEARPIYWMTRFDGFSLTKEDNDMAFMAFTILGLVPILYAELTGKRCLDEEQIYPMTRQVAEYAVNRLLVKREGRYYLDVPVVADVTPEALLAPVQQDAFVLLSLQPLLRKAAEYAERLGVDAERRARWLDAVEHLYAPMDDEGFILSADGGRRSGWPFGWIALQCLAPRDIQPGPSQEALWHEKTQPRGPHPWGCCVSATLAGKWQDAPLADAMLKLATSAGAYGLGYFAEFSLDGLYSSSARMLACIPPFSTAHGAYLYAMAEYYVRGHVWDDTVEIGPLPGGRHAAQPWSIKRLRALGGALVTAQGDAAQVGGTITASEDHGAEVTLVRPPALQATGMTLSVDGEERTVGAEEAPCFLVTAGARVSFALSDVR
jgi:hypothetical protein